MSWMICNVYCWAMRCCLLGVIVHADCHRVLFDAALADAGGCLLVAAVPLKFMRCMI